MRAFPLCFSFIFILCILAFGGLQSCKSSKVIADAPDAAGAATVYRQKLSTLNVPISIHIKELEAKLNQELKGVLYKDDKLEDDNFKFTVSKNGPIKLFTDNDLIYISIPIHVWALGRWEWQACDICPKFSKSEDTKFDMVINCQTSLSLNNHWQLVSHTTGDYRWGNQKPKLEIGPLTIPLARVVDVALKPQLANITYQLDKELQKRVDIKSYVGQAWNQLQQPVSLHPASNTWLNISPVGISMSKLQCRNDEVSLKVGISAYMETIIGSKPATKDELQLPPLKIDNNMKEQFNIGLSSEISYEQATEMLKQELTGKKFTFNNNEQEVTVKGLTLIGNGSRLQLKLDLDGKAKKGKQKRINATVYLQGVPYYDAAEQAVKVKDFDYELKTKNLLLKSAGWILKIGFDQKIKEKLNFPLSARMAQAQAELQDGLDKNGKLPGGIQLKGKIQKLEPEGIYLTGNTIKAVVNAEGWVNVLLEKF